MKSSTPRLISTYIALTLATSAIFTLGCKTRTTESGKRAVNAQSIPETGGVKFGFLKKAYTKLAGPATGNEALSDVVVTIKDEVGATVSEDRKIPLLKMGDSYVTAAIHLPPGNYTLEKFAVLEGDNVIYASPVTGSSLAHLVIRPLPLSIEIPKDDVATFIPEVIDVYEAVPADFGFSSFKFNIVKGFAFSVAVSIFNIDSGKMELTTAHIAVTGDTQPSFYDGELLAQTNQVNINDIDDTITITITKDGYTTVSKSLTTAELKEADLQNFYLDIAATP